jgi:UDP-glucose 4-epimerase
MKCLVTGGSGFIGSFIVEELAREGHDVIIYDIAKAEFTLPKNIEYFDGDTRYISTLVSAMKGVEEVYDIAGALGTNELMFSNSRAVDVNINGALNVLKAAKICGVKRLFHPTKPNDWLNTYSITKSAAEQFCLMFIKNFNMEIAILKWFNAYGPRQHLYPVRKAVPLFITQALYNRPLEVFGDGEQTVDMIYVEDIAKIAIKATRKCGNIGKVIDVGTGLPITVNDLAKMIIKMTKSKSKIIHLPMRKGEPERSSIAADVTMLKDVLEIDEFTPFEKGLKATIGYYKKLPEEELLKALDHYKKSEKRSWPL